MGSRRKLLVVGSIFEGLLASCVCSEGSGQLEAMALLAAVAHTTP